MLYTIHFHPHMLINMQESLCHKEIELLTSVLPDDHEVHEDNSPSSTTAARRPFYGVIDSVSSFFGIMEGPYDFGFAISITIDRQTFKGVVFKGETEPVVPTSGGENMHIIDNPTHKANPKQVLPKTPSPNSNRSTSSSAPSTPPLFPSSPPTPSSTTSSRPASPHHHPGVSPLSAHRPRHTLTPSPHASEVYHNPAGDIAHLINDDSPVPVRLPGLRSITDPFDASKGPHEELPHLLSVLHSLDNPHRYPPSCIPHPPPQKPSTPPTVTVHHANHPHPTPNNLAPLPPQPQLQRQKQRQKKRQEKKMLEQLNHQKIQEQQQRQAQQFTPPSNTTSNSIVPPVKVPLLGDKDLVNSGKYILKQLANSTHGHVNV